MAKVDRKWPIFFSAGFLAVRDENIYHTRNATRTTEVKAPVVIQSLNRKEQKGGHEPLPAIAEPFWTPS